MGKIRALPLLLTLLAGSACASAPTEGAARGPDQTGVIPPNGFESDHMAMVEIADLLERIGRDIRERGAVTFAGRSYPLSAHGGVEFNISRRPRGGGDPATAFQLEVSARDVSGAARPGRGAYTMFEGASVRGSRAEVAETLDRLAATLESTGEFVWNSHRAPFRGTAYVDRRLGQRTSPPRQPFSFSFDVTFGEGEFRRHDDQEDVAQVVERGQGVWLGSTAAEDVARAGVVAALREWAAGVRAGRLTVGEGSAAVGDSLILRFGHVVARDGSSDKIEMGLQWPGRAAPPTPEGEPALRYHAEPWGMPAAEFAELLRRIGAEILEDGTFTLDGNEYAVGDTVAGELAVTSRGMSVEVTWRR